MEAELLDRATNICLALPEPPRHRRSDGPHRRKVHQVAGTLSGGEKTELALSIVVSGRHNVLLLDEPTNNLDPGTRAAVAEGLHGWPRSIVPVSHDAPFVRDLEPDRVLLMPEGTLDHWGDDYSKLVELA